MPPIRWMRSIYRTAALRTPPLPKPSQPPSCLHCPVRQRLTYFRQYPTAPHSPFTHPPSTALSDVFPSQPASLTFCSIKKSPPVSEWRLFIHYFFNSHPKHDPHTHPNHYFSFSTLFRISSRYFPKNPGIFTPSRWIFQNLLRLRSSPDKSAPLIDSLAFLYRKRRKTNFCKLTFGF